MKTENILLKVKPQVHLPVPIWLTVYGLCFSMLFVSNPWLSMASIMTLPILALLVLRRAEPAVLFFSVALQWTQVATKVFHADLLGWKVEDLFYQQYLYMGYNFGAPKVEHAISYGLIGILILALGMRCGAKRMTFPRVDQLQAEVSLLSPSRLFMAYFLFFIVEFSLGNRLWSFATGNIIQIILAALTFKWVLFFLLGFTVLSNKRQKRYFFFAFMIEVLVGITGFYSDFKKPFYLLIILYLSLGYRLHLKTLLKVIPLGAILGVMLLGWMTIKGPYREYVLNNADAQFELTFINKLKYAFDLYRNAGFSGLSNSFESLMQRIAYVDNFAIVINNVPSRMPHTNGEFLQRTIKHILIPRFLFPNKPEVDDSSVTESYTRMKVKKGTTITLGYMTELFIDFGMPVMLIPLFVLGCIWGWLYKYFIVHSKAKVFGYALSVVVLMPVTQFELSLTNLIGGLTISFLFMAMVLFFFSKPFLKFLLLRPVAYRYRSR